MKSLPLALLSLVMLVDAPTLRITQSFTVQDGLPNNEVRTLYDEPNGGFWIGTANGAAWVEDGHWQRDQRALNPVTEGVSTILKDTAGRLWFGGLHKGHVYHGDSYHTFSIEKDLGLNGRVIFSFHEDQNLNIWAATTGGVSIFDGKSWQPFTVEHGLKHNAVHDIDQDEHGAFWFATRKGGLNIYDGTDWQYLYPEKNCRKIFKDDLNNMWVGTNDGILMFDGVQWHVFEAGKTVLPMFKGLKGYVWCIANGTDILRVSGNGKVIYYDNPTKSQASEIYALAQGENSAVWAGTDQGILVFN